MAGEVGKSKRVKNDASDETQSLLGAQRRREYTEVQAPGQTLLHGRLTSCPECEMTANSLR
jgi:hypothetical protein